MSDELRKRSILVDVDHNGNYIHNAKTSGGSDNDSIINKRYVDESLDTKQDTLVNSENIKTINGHSLLGAGDVDLPIPIKVSDLQNDSGYQTESEVIALIQDELSKFDKLDYEIVTTLPATGTSGVRYLVKHITDDRYEEYIYINGSWYDIGSTDEINLDNYYTKDEVNFHLSTKVNNTDFATDSEYGIVKLNSTEGISKNANGQLTVAGRLGQFPDGGLFYPTIAEPSNVGNYSLLISEAKNLSTAHRNLVIAGGSNINLKVTAAAGATEYRVTNSLNNRFMCAAMTGGRLAVDETGAKSKTVEIVSIKFANGNNVIPYNGPNENDNDIIITVVESLNPTGTLTKVRGYGKWTQADIFSVGQGNGSQGGKVLQIGQSNYSGNVNQVGMIGIRQYNSGASSILVGADNINAKQFTAMFGQGHNSTTGRNAAAYFGSWSDSPSSNTYLIIGNGSSDTNRSTLFEIRDSNGTTLVMKSPNGSKFLVKVDDDGNLTATKVTT